MSTLAAFKRRLSAGDVVEIDNFYWPEASGARPVIKVSSSSITMKVNERQFKYPTTTFDWPKAGDVTMDDDGLGFLARWPQTTPSGKPHSRAGQEWLRLRLVEAAT